MNPTTPNTNNTSSRKKAFSETSSLSIRNDRSTMLPPTYHLEPNCRFNCDICKQIIKKVQEQALLNFKYNPKKAKIVSQNICQEIQTRLRLLDYDRYKIVCVVTIGEKVFQGFQLSAKLLWDATMDEYINHVYDTPNIFCIATVYAVYYD